MCEHIGLWVGCSQPAADDGRGKVSEYFGTDVALAADGLMEAFECIHDSEMMTSGSNRYRGDGDRIFSESFGG